MDMYGSQKTEVAGMLDTVSRAYGTILTGFGVASWMCRDAAPSIARRSMLMLTLVGDALVTIVHINAIMQGTENNLAWLIVLLTGGIAIWSALLLSKEQPTELT